MKHNLLKIFCLTAIATLAASCSLEDTSLQTDNSKFVGSWHLSQFLHTDYHQDNALGYKLDTLVIATIPADVVVMNMAVDGTGGFVYKDYEINDQWKYEEGASDFTYTWYSDGYNRSLQLKIDRSGEALYAAYAILKLTSDSLVLSSSAVIRDDDGFGTQHLNTVRTTYTK